MRPRRLLPIARVPLVGSRPCLDFVNTTGMRGSPAPRERLHEFADLLVFGRRAGLVAPVRAQELQRLAAARPGPAARALGRMLELRETLFRVFAAAAHGRAPAASDLQRLGSNHAEASRCQRLAWRGRSACWQSEIARDDLLLLCGPLVRCAVELLTSPELAKVRQCGECDWLFLDTSRNGRRRWCKKTCGDRVKSRAYYRRTAARQRN
jgi:predicted RNA-binding Zn ribbon-like protein